MIGLKHLGTTATRIALITIFSCVSSTSFAATQQNIQPEARELLLAANQARASVGAPALTLDPQLTLAARQHCLRMASEGSLSHRYAGESELTTRASQSGSHFSLIEENVAVGPTVVNIHHAWMQSQGHRENLLNPDIDRVGIAVVASRGTLYAVADYARSVQSLAPAQVEAAISQLLRPARLIVRNDSALARQYCSSTNHLSSDGPNAPSFMMRWQGADLSQLPNTLLLRIGTGLYHEASVGSCKPKGLDDSFTAYRIVVLLY